MTRDGWMTVTEAAVRMRIPEREVLEMAVAGELTHRVDLDHQVVSLASVDAWVVSHRQAPDIGGGPDIGDEAEEEYRRSQRDDDVNENVGDTQ
ncbi:hypothetical protein Sme01_04140 [Sphaerisporangium melleum]|uniref:Helix-turn-helix domain-containing protein n=1 Tax=Sphaerisporangium melleum TaxID=321316 RepID=A0A917QQK5_9ACTN|nr:hypothetical protein [Sphaerisporangium melleum]GGK62188.1 hypothetical protein GCM10007964_01690 [Sphaerisporangium melleum]GII67938.1 hypothetical protein Sme01_04140 [Sphaerisporangium melleum]